MRIHLSRFALACALSAFGAGLLLLLAGNLGWTWLVQTTPGLSASPLTALSLCLSALTLLLCSAARVFRHPGFRLGGRLSALVLAGIGAWVLIQGLLGPERSFGLNVQLPRFDEDFNGQPSPQTAFGFILFGLAAWLYFGRRHHRFDLADVAAAASLFLPAAALLSYLFDLDLDRLGQAHSSLRFGMPPLAALGMTVLAGGLQSLHPGRGFASLLRAQPDGGFASRRMLLAAVLVPALLGDLQVWAIRHGIIDLSLGVAITVAACVMIFVVLLIWNAELVMRLHQEQRQQLAVREEQARREAATDSLTLLYNRRGWERCLLIEEQRSEREILDAGVFIIDLDGLKEINDREGHASGDALLQTAARALRACVRRRDVVARVGGDEYAFLATEIVPEVALLVEERLRKALHAVGVSASIGHALRSVHGSLPAAAEVADQAMYQDKRGRKLQREAAAEMQPFAGS